MTARADGRLEGRRIRIRGIVQGVGFRPWVYRLAREVGVTGWVRNDASGVVIEACAEVPVLEAFLDRLRTEAPPAAAVASVLVETVPAEPAAAFTISDSLPSVERRVSIPADLATCDRCVEEIFDPGNRRYRYPFTNCTDCGPRFTIAAGVPYDRAQTTMARFAMCDRCGQEYDSPDDRRFHAQPNACPTCGPRLELYDAAAHLTQAADPLAEAAAALASGLIVAVKGLGGVHLACDATSAEAVARLRLRKHRDQKPLAVMVPSLADARALASVGETAQRMLTAPERPIVLLPRLEPSRLAPNVAPRNRFVGLMLPYTPLHHLLLREAGCPLVMTSGNLSDEPIAAANDDALARLMGIADVFLLHDRDIQTRCDDTVAAVIAGRPAVLRRSRGHVPRAVTLSAAVSQPVLATGALLKNTFCIAAGDQAWLGPHIGDLENIDTYDAYLDAIGRMERFLDISPALVACDLHPDYLSTRYAMARGGAMTVAVQHHHAHVVSAMAEHGLTGPVIGLAFDGTGYGTDGTVWGGEVLLATPASFERLATFRPLALPGGDRAVREPWRTALGLVLDACGGSVPSDIEELFGHVDARDRAGVSRLLATRLNTPMARGVGRYFDAFGALFLRRPSAAFEGQVALEWNQAAAPASGRLWPFAMADAGGLLEIDLRPAVRTALDDWQAGHTVAQLSATFHDTMAAAAAEAVRRGLGRFGRLPVVASGGCFQNARLAEAVRDALVGECDLRLHEAVPMGDGGIALGQAIVADARSRG